MSSFTSTPSLASPPQPLKPKSSLPFSSSVSIDPDYILPEDLRIKFRQLLQTCDRIIDPDMIGYNGAADPSLADVARYSKPQPSLIPDVDTTLRTIAPWRYVIKTDLTRAFYQIPLSKSSLKYCGVATPFRGVRVYTRSAMGMPGSETALEEMMCRVLGDFIEEGFMAKLADDLYCGGDSPEALLNNWRRVLQALDRCNLRLSPTKTVICPKTTSVLGWIWSQGRLSANPHRIAALASCPPPSTVKGLRSFIGAYKVLSRVLPNCSNVIAPLECALTGLQSSDRLLWDENLTSRFKSAQDFLSNHKAIVLPRHCTSHVPINST